MTYQGIAPTVFTESEYRDVSELVVGMYLMINRDIAGVVPANRRVVAAECRISKPRLDKILDYFVDIKKIKISKNRTHIWLKSGIFHSLYKGKFSEKQMKSVIKTLIKWEKSAVFGQNFLKGVAQVYATKYSLTIPYADYIQSETETVPETKSKTKTDVQAKPDPAEKPTDRPQENFSIKILNQRRADFDKAYATYIDRMSNTQKVILQPHYENMKKWIWNPGRKNTFPKTEKGWLGFIDRWLEKEEGLKEKLDAIGS